MTLGFIPVGTGNTAAARRQLYIRVALADGSDSRRTDARTEEIFELLDASRVALHHVGQEGTIFVVRLLEVLFRVDQRLKEGSQHAESHERGDGTRLLL